MRVLLVQSYLGRKGVADQLVFPIGLSCVASALDRAGHTPFIVDLNVGTEDAFERLAREVREFEPDVVGINQRNLDSTTRKAPFIFHTQLRPILEVVKREAPRAATVLGGPGFTQASHRIMEKYDADFGVKSEGEDTIVQLLDSLGDPSRVRGVWWRKDGELVYNGDTTMPDFSTLPYPRRHYVDWELYRHEMRERDLFLDIGIESTRGCPRKCAYCNYPNLNGVTLRKKPVDVVVDEIEYLKGTFDIPAFTFTDSRFNENPNHARAICEELIRRQVKVSWVAWLGFRGIDSDLLGLMHDAGCKRVAFSPDGLLQPSLDRMRKEMTTQDLNKSIEAVRRVKGMRASWSFFLTPPSTSHKEQLAMLAYYLYIQGTMPGRARMVMNWCRVEENTYFEKIAREDGVIQGDVDLLPDTAEALEPLFYESPGYEPWATFWDRFLESELHARALVGRLTRPLHRFGVKDLTPAHMRGGSGV